MRILDRYVFKSVLSVFLTCIFLFLFLYVVIDIISKLEDILNHDVGWFTMLQYYVANLPLMFCKIAPFACLLSALYALGKMNHDNEIIAMRASGLSVFQITRTLMVLGAVVSLFMFWIGDRFVPRSVAVTQKVIDQLTGPRKDGKEKKPETIYNLSMYGMKNRLFFMNKFTPSTSTMEGITILEHDEHQNITSKIVANKAVYQDRLWKFYQTITYNFDVNGQILEEPLYTEEEILTIPETPKDFITQRQRLDQMDIAQLEDYIWRLSKSGATTVIRNLKVDLYQRYATPFTALIMLLLGIPFSLMMRKRATGLSSIGLCILVGFLYYIIDAVCVALGKSGTLFPVLAVSFTHIVAFFSALYLIASMP